MDEAKQVTILDYGQYIQSYIHSDNATRRFPWLFRVVKTKYRGVMYSGYRDLASAAVAREMLLHLVFPSEADFKLGKISILAPIGTALIGYRAGDTVEWKVPAGIRRLRIDEILYQPEAAGDHHL